jgi:hypothetical protein
VGQFCSSDIKLGRLQLPSMRTVIHWRSFGLGFVAACITILCIAPHVLRPGLFSDSGRVYKFPHEGVTVVVPNDALALTKMSAEFPHKPNFEPEFRRLVSFLYRNGVIDEQKNIVDTGCFIGDNAVAW